MLLRPGWNAKARPSHRFRRALLDDVGRLMSLSRSCHRNAQGRARSGSTPSALCRGRRFHDHLDGPRSPTTRCSTASGGRAAQRAQITRSRGCSRGAGRALPCATKVSTACSFARPSRQRHGPAPRRRRRSTCRKCSEPACFFKGNAREAASAYPQNANVAAAVALAGEGSKGPRSSSCRSGGPAATATRSFAEGPFGPFEIRMLGKTRPEAPGLPFPRR